MRVSIPFKREGTRKPIATTKGRKAINLVSIPFKREGTRKQYKEMGVWQIATLKFPFPSNGKARGNSLLAMVFVFPAFGVSIPFKREGTRKRTGSEIDYPLCAEFQFPSNGKVRGNQCIYFFVACSEESFNSLQTGRYAETNQVVQDIAMQVKFQFPSNGKVRGNLNGTLCRKGIRGMSSFDSLQTGRYAETSTADCG